MCNNFEICADTFIDGKPCISVVTYSPGGAEIWLFIDRESHELVAAQRIDGEWHDIDLEQAKQDYAGILYCI